MACVGKERAFFRRVAAEFRVVQLARCGAGEAIRELARMTLPLRQRFAGYYFKDQGLREEAEQQGWFGVLRAVANYEAGKGIPFTAYVSFQIRSAIGKYRFQVRHPVRLPAHIWEARRRAGLEVGREEAVERLARNGMRRDIAEMVSRISAVQIADHVEEDTAQLHCVLRDERSPDAAVIAAEVRRKLEEDIREACTPAEMVAVATQFELDAHYGDSRVVLTAAERRRNQALVDQALLKLRRRFGVSDPDLDGSGQRQKHFGVAEVA